MASFVSTVLLLLSCLSFLSLYFCEDETHRKYYSGYLGSEVDCPDMPSKDCFDVVDSEVDLCFKECSEEIKPSKS